MRVIEFNRQSNIFIVEESLHQQNNTRLIFPFASNLILPPHPHVPYIRYLEGDSLSFTVAESSPADFTLLTSDSPRDSYDWQPLAPVLPSQRTSHDGTCEFPLMAIQVTMIPNSGFSICVIFDHVAGDGRTLPSSSSSYFFSLIFFVRVGSFGCCIFVQHIPNNTY